MILMLIKLDVKIYVQNARVELKNKQHEINKDIAKLIIQ